MGWIVAPTYDLSEKIFRVCYWAIQKYAPQLIKKATYSQGNMELRTILGSVMKAKSADNPDSLIGEGLNWLICDEAARIKDQIWDGALRPSLADKKGWGIFISTPKGKNWFQNLFTRGQDPQQPEYASFTFPSSTNPYLDLAEIQAAKLTTPETLFRQEWLAEFIDDVGGVFRGVKDAITPQPLENAGWGEYVTGIDLAKFEDFTVIIVMEKKTKRVVYFERFNQLDWNTQMQRIMNAVNKFPNNTVVVDSTGVGDGIFDVLQKAMRQYKKVTMLGYKITPANKKELIDNLALAIERKELSYPNIPELINELQIYTYEITPQRNIRYNAPPGYHDDCVIALALAYVGINQTVSDGFFVYGYKV